MFLFLFVKLFNRLQIVVPAVPVVASPKQFDTVPAKELLGLDQYQLMSATAIVRFWTLVLAAYVFLEEERARLTATTQQHVTIGDAQRAIQRAHWVHLLNWLRQQFQHQEAFASIVRQLAA